MPVKKHRCALRERLADERGEIRALFLKMGLAAALVALILVQIGPILANKIEITGINKDAVDIGVNKYRVTKGDLQEVQKSVTAALEERGARLVGNVTAYQDESGTLVLSFTSRKIARTWLFYHVSYLAPYMESVNTVTTNVYD